MQGNGSGNPESKWLFYPLRLKLKFRIVGFCEGREAKEL